MVLSAPKSKGDEIVNTALPEKNSKTDSASHKVGKNKCVPQPQQAF
jgi:hypothetical protein